METHSKYCVIMSTGMNGEKQPKCNCGYHAYRKSMEENTLYQGFTNSATWSCAYLVGQERVAYEVITAIRKEGKEVTGNDVKAQFDRLNLRKDSWTKGKVNWGEIADTYNQEEYS